MKTGKMIRLAIVIAAAAAAVVILFSGKSITEAEEERNPQKFYTSIEIKPGDSLWSIACRYSDGHYSSIQKYIEELKQINNLSSDTIHAFEYLLVPYYSTANTPA